MIRRGATALIMLATSAALASCGGEGSDGVFEREGYPFEFSYPEALSETEDVTVDQQLGTAAEETVGIGLDEDNGILVEHFELRRAVTRRNLGAAKQEIEGLFAGVDSGVSLTETSIGGFPALTAEDVEIGSGTSSDLAFLFDGTDEYLINCQSTEESRADIDRACEEALDSLEPT